MTELIKNKTFHDMTIDIDWTYKNGLIFEDCTFENIEFVNSKGLDDSNPAMCKQKFKKISGITLPPHQKNVL